MCLAADRGAGEGAGVCGEAEAELYEGPAEADS